VDSFVNKRESKLYTIELEHLRHEDVPCMALFYMNGKVYCWNGRTELVSVETGELLAQFFPSRNISWGTW